MNQHWTEADFLKRLYAGAGASGVAMERHLEECAACRSEWETVGERRQQVLRQEALRQEEAVGVEFLAAQRQRIEERIEARGRTSVFVRWSPALAVAGMALCVVLWKSPTTGTKAVELTTTADAQLMTDIYQTVYSSEPDVVEPLRGLFEPLKSQGEQR